MNKAVVTVACFVFLSALIVSSLQIVARTPALAQDANCLQTFEANCTDVSVPDGLVVNTPLEMFGSSSSDPLGLSPANITAVYNLPSSGGIGTIAIIDAYDDPTVYNDVLHFDETYGLPELDLTIVHFNVPPGQNISSNINWTGEIALDVEWAHAIAPSAKILLVETYNDSAYNLLNAVYWARSQTYWPDVVSISMSWGLNEFSGETSLDPIFSQNVSFFAASGDLGENVSWPASSPNVVGVGGTKLNFNPNGSLASEVVWNDGDGYTTGGGISAFEIEPSYQLSYGVQGSNGHRSVPDVSFDAGTGVSVYCSSPTTGGTGWLSVGGTSLGAPCWAAINSLNRTASNPRLYAIAKSVYNSSSLRDITTGTNGNYNATTGYDFCTGLGSPLTSAFVSLLPGDVNLDGTVDLYDAILLGGAFLSVPGDWNWNSFADIKMDNVVDIYDALLLSAHWGQNYTGGTRSGMLGGTLDRPATLSGGASVLVNPNQITVFRGEVFTVNVDVTSVTDLQGWEFKLYWNSTILNCTNVVVQVPAEWQNNNQNYGPGLEPSYNATHARYWQAEVGAYPAASFNGSTTFATFTFQAMQPGTTSLTLADVKLGNSTGHPIDYSPSSGSMTVYYGRYMRSDTQQVNGLSAYSLNIPQSTNSVVNTQSGSGMDASWGIRAWIRHSNGVEQEISLDGQTGTPTATVYGGPAGIKWNTVSVAQTALQSTDSLVVRVYVTIGEGPWNLCATFTTQQLQASTLKATTWTVYYYTSSVYNHMTDRTTAKFYWGTTTYNTRIQNLQYS